MKLRDIVWTGVQTERFDDMAAFITVIAGEQPAITEPGFNLWALPSGDLIELFAPGHKPSFGAGPVVGFLVQDLEASRRDVEAAGGEIVSSYGPNEDGYATYHFRAPDGNVYEIVRDPKREERTAALRGAEEAP